ncbi:MAG: hypothetical protein ACO3RV_04080 [Luteolibacter sp.]
MTRIILFLTAGAAAILTASCCCTSDTKAPGLPRLPKFQEIKAEQPLPDPVVTVEATK